MAIGAIQKMAKGQNGVGAFLLQCRKLDFHYCDWAGSSRGMNDFLKKQLPAFARANPQIEMTVSPRPRKHPIIRGHYLNGRQKAICVKNMSITDILAKAEILRDASGEKLRRVVKPVKSWNESVRGIWDPFHQKPEERWRI